MWNINFAYSQDVNIDHMIQTNEIVVLQPKDNIACSICDNKWTGIQ